MTKQMQAKNEKIQSIIEKIAKNMAESFANKYNELNKTGSEFTFVTSSGDSYFKLYILIDDIKSNSEYNKVVKIAFRYGSCQELFAKSFVSKMHNGDMTVAGAYMILYSILAAAVNVSGLKIKTVDINNEYMKCLRKHGDSAVSYVTFNIIYTIASLCEFMRVEPIAARWLRDKKYACKFIK